MYIYSGRMLLKFCLPYYTLNLQSAQKDIKVNVAAKWGN